LVLVDAGAAKVLGPKLGQIVTNLKAAGHTPEQVDVTVHSSEGKTPQELSGLSQQAN
jgi:hypothetical protein